MFSKAFSFKTLVLFAFRLLLKQFRNPKGLHRSFSNAHAKFQKYPSLAHRVDLSDQTLVFRVEGALLKSPSLFPYFMLVAFEAGSLIRALVLLILHPFICFVGDEMGLKVMVMVSFFGIKEESFKAGRAVLPKFFLEDVGLESFEVLRRSGKRVGVSDMPQVMVESFLREYLEIEFVVGRELKVCCGYFVGLMEDKKKIVLDEIFEDEKISSKIIGLGNFNRSHDHHLFSRCKEIYLASEGDRRQWHDLPRDRYPQPLIFHDGRLAIRPTPAATLAMFMWVPFGFTLALIRSVVGLFLPYDLLIPILGFSGLRLTITNPNKKTSVSKSKQDITKPKTRGHLYVCNHRTLFDPLYFSFGRKKPVTAVTYSLSRVSEFLAPIRTVRLNRDRNQDAMTMEKMLSKGDLIVCPEGTTCREPYLLRFSPLFAELSDEIVPVAMDTQVSMFYGTTAGGFKCLDPLFFLMNPSPIYTVRILDKVCGAKAEKSGIDVANYVQSELGKALGFECTRLTRRDKYVILAGNDGIMNSTRKKR
ncbi:Glycerol-3-phosphate acyltransferase [Actinidia chinensis var. chinensis]|uniref:Glycerol-3-phosphate acyltransferase n=1 Tax=Actinidia chinensis var. chinensis TaxID=1590841 RepID=A0A2R6P5P6_ACTCC|nr:Glycerol-3-phosphate acyltransferase [Actinidia chinensis var. chinensis]